MHNILLGEFFLLYFLMLVVFVVCAIHEGLVLSKKKKAEKFTWISRIIACSTVVHFIINLIGFDFDPRIKLWIYIALLAVSLCILGREVKSKLAVILPALFLAVIIVMSLCFLGPCTFTRIMAGDPYVSVYCPFTGIGKTYAYNFEPHLWFFIETRVDSADCYGIHLGDWRDIPDLVPVSTEYFE